MVAGAGGIMFQTAFAWEKDVAGYGTIRNSCGLSATMFFGVILSSKSKVGKIVRSITGADAILKFLKDVGIFKMDIITLVGVGLLVTERIVYHIINEIWHSKSKCCKDCCSCEMKKDGDSFSRVEKTEEV
jgi:hypothetical protein